MGVLAWPLICIVLGRLLCAWAVVRLQVRFRWVVFPLGLLGSVVALVATSYGDDLTRRLRRAGGVEQLPVGLEALAAPW